MTEETGKRGDVMGAAKEWTREELLEVIDELRSAAGAVYSECSGSGQIWMRLGRLVEEMKEPNRKAYCAIKGREYLPPPAEF